MILTNSLNTNEYDYPTYHLVRKHDGVRTERYKLIHFYGKVEEVPQNENTPFHPYSPYAVAKQYGFWIVKEYREAYNMFCCSGILFNHESERRGETFVTRKITLAAARIKQGKQSKLYLGNLDSLRDWGYAKDYVECMWLILQAEKPEDFVIATGKQHSVREFAQLAFHYVGIELKWEGKEENEKGICVEEELSTIVDAGGHVKDVFVYHKVYGVIRANMDIKSRRDVRNYLEEIRTGKSSLLKNVTSGYHYHTICAESEEVLDAIQEELKNKGFLAKLQDYEPVDFWGDSEDEAKA